ncbi:MAG: hypothetical protein CMC54_03635 [Flavobacteriaceae bacterium]|nr:hypothetical protein [Flavobacteriaceae bacterium]
MKKKITTYFNDRKINLEISEYVVKVSIDTLGNFSVVNISSEGSPSNETKKHINEAFKSLPKALPAVKTNVGEYVDVVFDLPIKLVVK